MESNQANKKNKEQRSENCLKKKNYKEVKFNQLLEGTETTRSWGSTKASWCGKSAGWWDVAE
jgi:hypothetical protein